MKYTVKEIKIQTIDQKEIIANHSSDNELIPRIHKKKSQISTVKKTTTMNNIREDIRKANKLLKSCSTSLAIREM